MVCGPSAHNGVVIHLLAAAAVVADVSRIHMHLLSPLALSLSLFLSLSIRVHVLCPQTVLSHGSCCHLPVLQYQSTVPVHPPTHNPTNSYTHKSIHTNPPGCPCSQCPQARIQSLAPVVELLHTPPPSPTIHSRHVAAQSCTLSVCQPVSQSVSRSVGQSSSPIPYSVHPSIHPSRAFPMPWQAGIDVSLHSRRPLHTRPCVPFRTKSSHSRPLSLIHI